MRRSTPSSPFVRSGFGALGVFGVECSAENRSEGNKRGSS
ncbi:hypothetical protein COLINT_03389 [Collinsella intestinalis DSM 13280]|uniref:Uncharacterized protein n=1 Tax=Collinsella intestinalis DSM 13280 TaxID=521003 RepID=C4FBD6_9ACTN|nr:hypothetical protein COLINT_03389 [Collinsella intestinalis DSM 13280]